MRLSNAGASMLVTLSIAIPTAARAQIDSGISSVTLNASLAETLTVSVTSGSTVNFTLTPGGTSNGSTPVTIETTWNLGIARTNLSLYGYFDTPTAALTDGGGNDIPSSAVSGQMITGLLLLHTAFTQTNALGPAGGGLKLFNLPILIVNIAGTRSDNLNLRINLSSLSLPSGSYTGTLRLQARAL